MIPLPRMLTRGLKERREPAAPRTLAVGDRDLPVIVRRLRTARRITLRLAPDGSEARISMPEWGRTADALRFAEQRRDWLAAQLARIPPPVRIEPGCTLAYRGTTLRVEWRNTAPRRPALQGETLVLGGPQDGMEARLRRWLEAEALRLCAADLAHYCERAGQAVPRLALSRALRRWGSCSSRGVIRINWRLIMAPDHVRRSVVAHEVAHMTHFDHSPAFHAHLDDLYEAEIEDANRWLKREGRLLYHPFG
ncbi:SprT family zinc-dependent metalloprotease [Novosphingobium sp. PASSN1]|uniref:M48 family metallopeptidase n=1 Tax=Novosphingobium sp. PASSN1 TaxID=2015561 RepID=UPI0025FD2A79|nr:SprT family zinc-dependent metalloprotease [Novosphingobium sp. PASSN1]